MCRPQCLFLDEPTNFLDREALGGLAVAIKEWGGAVCIISHSTEFVTALCPEIWHVDNGELTHKGKQNLVEDAFDDPSRPGSRTTSKAGTPRNGVSRVGTPLNGASAATSAANSGDEGESTAPGTGATTPAEGDVIDDLARMALKPKKKKKKTRNEIKASEERKRIRKVNWLSYGGEYFPLSSTFSLPEVQLSMKCMPGAKADVQASVSPTPTRTRPSPLCNLGKWWKRVRVWL